MKRSGSFDEGRGQEKRLATSDVDRAVDLARLQHEHELERLAGGLRRATEKKLVLADRHRKLQIKNINDLFDYEVKDVQAQFDKALCEAKERLEKELGQVIKQLKEKASACESPSKNDSGSSSGSSSSSSSGGGGGGDGGGSGSNTSSTSGLEKANVPKAKATSTRKPTSSSSSNQAAAALSSSSLATSITQTLSKEQRRTDFKFIVQDIQTQAAALGKTKPIPPQSVHVDASTNTLVVMSSSGSKRNQPSNKQNKNSSMSSSSSSSVTSLTNTDSAPEAITAAEEEAEEVNIEHFAIGDMVQVFSPMSGQEFSGLIHSIEQSQIVVRSGHGSFFSFLTSQVANGAVCVRKDLDATEAADLIAAALKSTTAYSKSNSSNSNDNN